MQQYLGVLSEESWRGQSRMVDAMVKWPTSSEPNETGLNLANKISNSFLTDIENSPERAKRSNDTMTFSHADAGLVRLLLSSHTTGAP